MMTLENLLVGNNNNSSSKNKNKRKILKQKPASTNNLITAFMMLTGSGCSGVRERSTQQQQQQQQDQHQQIRLSTVIDCRRRKRQRVENKCCSCASSCGGGGVGGLGAVAVVSHTQGETLSNIKSSSTNHHHYLMERRPTQQRHRVLKRIELAEVARSARIQQHLTTAKHRHITVTTSTLASTLTCRRGGGQRRRGGLVESSSNGQPAIVMKSGKRRRVSSPSSSSTLSSSSLSSSLSSNSSSSSLSCSSSPREIRRQFAQADLSMLGTSTPSPSLCSSSNRAAPAQLSIFSTHNKFLFNSTCSSCLTLNCDCCCKRFPFNEPTSNVPLQNIETRPIEMHESKPIVKRRTPFEGTFSEFLSSTPKVRGASTSTRRVRSIFANQSSALSSASSSKPIYNCSSSSNKKLKSSSSRFNKIVRTATNLFAGVSTTSSVNMINYPVETAYAVSTPTVNNTNDNFKNLGDFLVWYV